MMSEDKTQHISDSRSFEERVFARFDSLDSRFDSLELRMTALESRLDAVESRLDAMELRLDAMELRLDSMELRLDSMESRLDSMESRLQTLEVESERRSFETKPIWERALAQIEELQRGFSEFRDEVRESFRDISRKFGVIGNDLLQLRANQSHLETRLGKLESEFQR